jgi:hypothetical protein
LYCSLKSSPMISPDIVKEEIAKFSQPLSSQLEENQQFCLLLLTNIVRIFPDSLHVIKIGFWITTEYIVGAKTYH